jgi:hypothetical protein
MNIKAKFTCENVVDTTVSDNYSFRVVNFRAVYSKEGENASFSKATPSGALQMQIDKETAAYKAFTPGKNYYLTFEETEQ